MAAPQVDISFTTPAPVVASSPRTVVDVSAPRVQVQVTLPGCETIEVSHLAAVPVVVATEASAIIQVAQPASAEITIENTGAPGPQGAQGVAGPVGPQGPDGPQGVDGSVGPAGPPGSQGIDGPDGPTGPAGNQGPDGPTGNQGDPGLAGVTGSDGPAGPTGGPGPTGSQGPDGPQGDQGDLGPQGNPGPAGATGNTGLAGVNGATGATGATGTTGAQGPAGPEGDSIHIVSGLPGNGFGDDGDVAFDPSTGDVFEKAAGTWSNVGNVTGPIGATGAAGPVGPLGPQGNDGLNGPQGPVGTTGATGSIGPAGTPGSEWHKNLGVGPPNAAIGVDGDFAIDSAGDVFRKIAGNWAFCFNIAGPPGPALDNKTHVTSGAPLITLGIDGDLAIDCASTDKDLYLKITGVWVFQCKLDVFGGGGGGGDTLHVISAPPLPALGVDGDDAIDCTPRPPKLYSKAGGVWTFQCDLGAGVGSGSNPVVLSGIVQSRNTDVTTNLNVITPGIKIPFDTGTLDFQEAPFIAGPGGDLQIDPLHPVSGRVRMTVYLTVVASANNTGIEIFIRKNGVAQSVFTAIGIVDKNFHFSGSLSEWIAAAPGDILTFHARRQVGTSTVTMSAIGSSVAFAEWWD